MLVLGAFHGSNGELYVGQEVDSKFKEAFFNASQEQGLVLRDFNSQFVKGKACSKIFIKSINVFI